MKKQTLTPLFIKNIVVVTASFWGGFYFTSLFHGPTSLLGGLWAVISGIIVLEATHTETFTSAKNRIIGSLIGAILSGIYLFFFPFSLIGLVTTIGIGVLICYVLRIPQSIKLTGITISVIMIVSTLEHKLHPFFNAGLRFAECAIGTLIAVGIALLANLIEGHIAKRSASRSK